MEKAIKMIFGELREHSQGYFKLSSEEEGEMITRVINAFK